MGMTVAELMVKIGADVSGAEKGLQSVSSRLGSFGKQAGTTGLLMSAGLTAPILGVAKSALDMGMTYQSSMNLMQAVSGATAEQMAAISQKAIDLGNDMSLPATSAADAGKAMTELAKAGLSVNDTMAAAKGVLEMSAAGDIDNATAAQIAANALNAFHLQGTEATRIADLLAAAANASSSEVGDLGLAVQQGASVFATAGIPIENFVAAVAQMSNAGIKGQDAGTMLKQMMLQLEAPTKQAADIMSGLGITLYDGQGKMLSFRDIIGQFSTKMTGLTQAQQNQALATIFGSHAVNAANIVLMGGVEAFDKMEGAVTKQGAAADLAGARMKGLGGALEGLKSQVETVMLSGTQPFLDQLEAMVRRVADLVGELPSVNPQILAFGAAFLAVLAAAGPVLAAVGAISGAIAFLVAPVGLVVAATALLAGAWASDFGGIREITTQVLGTVQSTIESVFAFVSPFIMRELMVITTWWNQNFGLVQKTVQTVMTWIQNLIQADLAAIAAFWQADGEEIMAIVQAAWTIISTVIDTTIHNVLDILKVVMQLITGDWQGAWDTMQGILGRTWGAMKEIVKTGVNVMIDFIDHLISAWNGLTFQIPHIDVDLGPAGHISVGGQSFGVPQLPLIPALAAGGPVQASLPYLVGENGPELFVPSSPGTVLPNGAGIDYDRLGQAMARHSGRGLNLHMTVVSPTPLSPVDIRREQEKLLRSLALQYGLAS